MATESVKRIPGLNELVGPLLQFKDPEQARSAAENVHLPVTRGIEAIGEILWWASQHEDFGAFRETRTAMGDLGCLLKHLGEMANLAHVAEVNAAYQLNEANPKAA